MRRITDYAFYVFIVTFLFSLMTTMNSQFVLVSLEPSYATPQLQEDSASENNDSSLDISRGSETTRENTNPEESGGSNDEENSKNNDDDINEEGPIQQQQQQSERLPQQNLDSNPSHNRFINPRIDRDSSLTNNIQSTETTTTTPTQKSINPAGQYKPGSGLTELNIPQLSEDPAIHYTPGAGNAEVQGVGWAHLTVISNFTNAIKGIPIDVEVCVYTSYPTELKSIRDEIPASPYCTFGDFDGTFHMVQAPGLVGIRASGGYFETVDTSSCEFNIYPKQSKSCVVNFINNSPFLDSGPGNQDTVRTPIK